MHALRDVLTHASPEKSRDLFSFLGYPFSDTPHNPPSLPPAIDVRRSAGRYRYQQLMTVCERIKTMTDEFGYQALVAEAHHCGIAPPYRNRYDLAVEVFCRDPAAFKRAESIRYASRYDEEYFWSCFHIFRGACFTKQMPMEAFTEGAKVLLCQNEVQRNSLVVDSLPLYDRKGEVETWQVIVGWEGVPQHYETVEEGNRFAGGVYCPVQKYTLLYNPQKGRLEVVSDLPSGGDDVANLFARTVLGIHSPLSTLVPADLNLELFLERPALYFGDEHPVEAEIEWVVVSELVLESSVSTGEITIRSGIDKVDAIDAYQFLNLHDQSMLVRSGLFRIKRVRIAIRFRASDDGVRYRETLHVDLMAPNRYSMDTQGERAHYVREVLFPRWGILLDGEVA